MSSPPPPQATAMDSQSANEETEEDIGADWIAAGNSPEILFKGKFRIFLCLTFKNVYCDIGLQLLHATPVPIGGVGWLTHV